MGQDGGKGEYGERGPKGDIGPEVKYNFKFCLKNYHMGI